MIQTFHRQNPFREFRLCVISACGLMAYRGTHTESGLDILPAQPELGVLLDCDVKSMEAFNILPARHAFRLLRRWHLLI